MTENSDLQSRLAHLPAVDELLHEAERRGLLPRFPRGLLLDELRSRLAVARERMVKENLGVAEVWRQTEVWVAVASALTEFMAPALKPVINATGVVIHTNLGRSPLPECAVAQIAAVARGYSNLEYDLNSGRRSLRYVNVEGLLCRLSGAEAAMVVNNNAGAVLLVLAALAAGREVVVSRGELVEIGGAFRIPEVVVQGGAILREVGATNRTHLRDYEAALNENTALLLKVHTSNYRLLGFTGQPTIQELVGLGRQHDIPVVEDLGSGNLIDLKAYGLPGEPTLAEVMKSGVDLATFSGDKLLGGPQAGIVVGRRKLVEKLKKHPLNRALRIDKMTLAGLEAVLKCYLEPATLREQVPTLRMLTDSPIQLKKKSQRLKRVVRRVCENDARLRLEVRASTSRAGGGALPMVDLPGFSLFCQLSGKNPLSLEKYLRARTLPVITRIVDDWLVFDPRTIDESEFPEVGRALQELLLLSGETVV